MITAAYSLLIVGITSMAPPAGLRPRDVSCLPDGSVVAVSHDLKFIKYNGSTWRIGEIPEPLLGLWRSPDARLFGVAAGPIAINIAPGNDNASRWRPITYGDLLFAFLDGVVAVSVNRLYRLEPGGITIDIGPTPPRQYGLKPFGAPTLLQGASGLVACFAGSMQKMDAGVAACEGPGPNGYHYRVDFTGASYDPNATADAAPPFACGGSAIYFYKGSTHARRLSDGVPVASTRAFAARGSACLPDGRVLLIGKRQIGLFTLPHLHPVWNHPVSFKIESASLCGDRVVLLPGNSVHPIAITLP